MEAVTLVLWLPDVYILYRGQPGFTDVELR
jgi:hypothetical protein